MKSKDIELNLVIQLLERKKQELVEDIQAKKGANQEAIALKNQVIKAIDCLKMCQRLPQRYIASYLGITPEFLSKIKKS